MFEADTAAETEQEGIPLIHHYTLEELHEYARTVQAEELRFIRQAFTVNYALFEEGLNSPKTGYAKYLLTANGGKIFSDDEQKTASLLCNAAIEARVLGLSKPAMSITGSGAYGIIATMPLYAAYKVKGYSEEALLRATALSFLVCMYIKEYSGKLSAFCGCGIAAGTGMAAAGSDARMSGCELPVVINSCSGNQGITVSVPVIEYAKALNASKEKLYRALTLSNLIAIHEESCYSGGASTGAKRAGADL